jgi:hypothetical protein
MTGPIGARPQCIRHKNRHARLKPGAIRHHPDDLVRDAVEPQRLPQDPGCCSQPGAPETLGEDDHIILASYLIVSRLEPPAQQRRHPKDTIKRRSDAERIDFLRLAQAREIKRIVGVEKQTLECLLMVAPVDERRAGDRVLLAARKSLKDIHEASRLGIRLGPQQDGVDGAEDCRVGADAQSQSKDGHRRETGGLAQLTDRKTQVFGQLVRPSPATRLPRLLL